MLKNKLKICKEREKKKIHEKIDEMKSWIRDNQKSSVDVYKREIEEFKSFLKKLNL